MRNRLIASLAVVALTGGVSAAAQEQMNHADHQRHMAPMAGDGRQQVDFPPEMRQHTLANMRDHLSALSEILAAMSGGEYAKAGRIAEARLGMDSPSAEGCKSADAAATPMMSKPAGMDHQMSQFMPEGMRQIGLEMHQAASAFAAAAAKAGKTGNAKPALASLSLVTRQCTACHASYKVQ